MSGVDAVRSQVIFHEDLPWCVAPRVGVFVFGRQALRSGGTGVNIAEGCLPPFEMVWSSLAGMLCASTSYLSADPMSFLSELKSHATALQSQQLGVQQDLSTNTQSCEFACKMARKYLQELCAQLNVIRPPAAGDYSLNAKQPFPPLVLVNFQCDARTKMLRNAEAMDYIGMGWDLLPAQGNVAVHSVTVNFPPDLERVTSRLSIGKVQHERKEQRHPETNKLLAYVFEYETQARGFVTITPDHDRGEIAFRISNVGGFCVENTTYPATQVTPGLMDELARKLVGQASRFG